MADRATLRAETYREQLETLARVARGETLRSIARDQHLTPSAINMRCRRLYLQLGARNAAHAVAIAYERGLLPLEANHG